MGVIQVTKIEDPPVPTDTTLAGIEADFSAFVNEALDNAIQQSLDVSLPSLDLDLDVTLPSMDLDASMDVTSAAANDPLTEGQSPSKNFPILNQCVFGESFSA